MISTRLRSLLEKSSSSHPLDRKRLHLDLWRTNLLTKDTSAKKEEEQAEKIDLLNWTAHIFSQTVAAEKSWDHEFGKSYLNPNQIAAVGTFLPNELVSLVHSGRRYSTFIGASMIADISGFTTLCETYAKFGPEGAFRLTAILNSYIGAMVDLIYTFGGDLLKFAGDAFIAAWHCRLNEFINHKVHEAIACAMHIQYSLGTYQTDVGVMLKVKIAISAGNFVFSLVGDELNSSYIIYGYPVLETKKAEGMAQSGDTIIAPSAWNLLSPRDYFFEEMPEGYIKLKRILYDPRKLGREVFDFDARLLVEINLKNENLRALTRKMDLISSSMSVDENIRPNLFGTAMKDINQDLRPFVIAPVMQQIDAMSSFEHLTEMRQVTIMFIKMKPGTTKESNIIKLTDMVYSTIAKIVKGKLGLVNKVCMFDKDIMFLVIFGMKGFKEKDESLRCLRCAYQIHSELASEELIKSLSTGVTIGTTYCGVVGHPLRKEYTVIGGAVNRAARLMCAFDNVISCDYPVVLNSKLPLAFFKRLPPKTLKGIGVVSNIYQYEENGLDTSKIPPILGRSDILQRFQDVLFGTSKFKGVVVMGDPRCGKTRLLHEFVGIADSLSWKTYWVSIHTTRRHGMCLLHKVFANMLGRTVKERMAKLIKLFLRDPYYHYLFVTNDIFDVNFAFPFQLETPTEVTPMFMFMRTLKLISVRTVLVIDDAHGLDNESWSVFLELIQHQKYIVIISLPSAWQNKQVNIQKYLNSPKVVSFHLETLDVASVPALVCQMLNVEAVPRKLVRVLVKLSKGNPGWVQTFLLSYMEDGFISVKLSQIESLPTNAYIIPDKILLRTAEYSVGENLALSPSRTSKDESSSDAVVPVCKVKKQLDENALPATFDDVIMSMFDRQSSFEQLLLKCASILGTSFTRSDLVFVMSDPPEREVAPAIKRLFDLYVLCCASQIEKAEDKKNYHNKLSGGSDEAKEFNLEEIRCNCKSVATEDSQLPNYAFCKNPAFKFNVFGPTINATIPLNQKIDFHARALESIKKRNQKCEYCQNNELSGQKLDDVIMNPSRKIEDPELLISDGLKDTAHSITSSSSLTPVNSGLMMKELVKFRKKAAFEQQDNERNGTEIGTERQEKSLMSRLCNCFRRSLAKKGHSTNLSYLDFPFPTEMKCQCFKDLSETFEQLVHHARMAELLVDELKYLIAFSILSLNYSRDEKALKLLKQAENVREQCLAILTQEYHTSQDEAKIEKKKKTISNEYMKYTKKQIMTYLGKCYLNLGNIQNASAYLGALSSQTDVWLSFWFQMLLMNWPEIPLTYRKRVCRKMVLKTEVHYSLSQTYLVQNDLRKALNTGIHGATYAKGTQDIRHRCLAFANALELTVMKGKFKNAKKLEKKFCKSAIKVYFGTSVSSLISMGNLLVTVFKSRYFAGFFKDSIEVGELALKIAQVTSCLNAEVYMVQKLVAVYLLTKNFEKIQEILHPQLYMKEQVNTHQHTAKMKLYHRIILDIFLESSVALESPIRILRMLKASIDPNHCNPEHPSTRALGLTIWLWYLRKDDFNRAFLWQVPEYLDLDTQQDEVFTLLRIVQCQLLWLENKMETNEFFTPQMDNVSSGLQNILKTAKNVVKKIIPYLLPRYYHLRAYYTLVTFDDFGTKRNSLPGLKFLSIGHEYAIKHGNLLEQAWISHSRRLWYTPEKVANPNFFVEHMDDDAIAVEDLDNYDWSEILFSLKIPEKTKQEIKRLSSYVSLPDSLNSVSPDRGENNYDKDEKELSDEDILLSTENFERNQKNKF